jgi:hypothetical protein
MQFINSTLAFDIKGKGKVHPITDHEGPEGEKYSSTLSLTLALGWMSGQLHDPAAFSPGKRLGAHCTGGWGGPQTESGRVRKMSPTPGFDPRTVHPVAIRYTD